MKKFIRLAALLLVVSSLALVLVSCTAKPSGTYEAVGQKITFKGNKVKLEVNAVVASKTFEGKFEMDGDNIVITWDGTDASFQSAVYDKENDTIKAGIITFKKSK